MFDVSVKHNGNKIEITVAAVTKTDEKDLKWFLRKLEEKKSLSIFTPFDWVSKIPFCKGRALAFGKIAVK